MTHSFIGASSAERFMNCPGSVQLVASIPPQPESIYAKEGTAAHKLAEKCLKEKMNPFSLIGTVILGVEVTETMADAVQVYIETIASDLGVYDLSWRDLEVERKFHLKAVHKDAFGTNDANLPVFLTKCIVYDFKYGSGVAVEAEDNRQMQYYALGAAVEGDYLEFELVIVQPRASHKEGLVRRWTISRADLDVFAKALKEAIIKTEAPNAPLICGDWCRKTFCPAMAVCKSVRERVEESALTAFGSVEPASALPKPEGLSKDQLKKVLDNIPLIDTFIKAVEAYALDKANKGETVLGYKLVSKRSNRQWADEDAVKKEFGKLAVTTIVKVLSPTQLENTLKLTMKAKEAKAKVEPLTVRPDTGNVLVPLSDPREAVSPRLEQAFTDVTQIETI